MRPGATALLACLLALVPVLAGCTTPPAAPDIPQGRLVPMGGAVNQQATADPAGRQANELSIAVNPTDPLNILATGKDYTQPFAGQCVWDGLYVSHDGGATWKDSNLLGSPWKARDDVANGRAPAADAGLSKFYCATDPVVAFGPDGTAYWAVMPYQCDPGSGSATGAGTVPPGGFNDWLWTCSSMWVLASHDGGDSWPTVSQVAFGPRLENDKSWIAVSPKGTVLLCWDQDSWASGALRDDYNALTQGSGAPPYPDPAYVPNQPVPTGTVCSKSDDQAKTWTEPALASADAAVPWIDYLSDGTAAMAAVDATHILFLTSGDGLSWSGARILGNYTNPSNALMNGFSSLNGSAFRVSGFPSMSIDRSGGAHDGWIYVTWMDAATGAGRTMFTTSHDGGKTWMPPTWIHDLLADDGDQRGDQFMPSVSAGPDGTVDLSWMDRRVDPANHLFDCFYAFSTDGGITFSKALRVSNVSSDEQYSHHQNGAIFLGDYLQTASSAGAAHPVWVDTRNHKADVYTATIARPGAYAQPA